MARTIFSEVAETARRQPERIALMLASSGKIEETTYGGMLAQILSVASHLSDEAVGKGDRVIILGENHPQWVMAYFACLASGAVAVPLDPAGSVDALSNFLDKSEARTAFVSAGSIEKFREVCELTGRRVRTIVLNSPDPGISNGRVRFEDWARNPVVEHLERLPVEVDSADLAELMFTSGTTGFPKAVPLTHSNIRFEAHGIQDAMKIGADETALALLPLFHVYSQIISLWLMPMVGGRIVFVTDMNSAAIESAVREGRVTALIGVPRVWYLFHKKIFEGVSRRPAMVRRIFHVLLALNGLLRDRIGINLGRIFFREVHEGFGGRLRLTVSGGASFDQQVARDFHRLGFTLLQGYGLTETCGAATITRFEDNVIGSVGSPLDNVRVEIADPGPDGIGEVLIRGPIVTPGYLNNPEANREAFTEDGWFRTGDLGRIDRRGHLFIVGRSKDVIKLPSGKNVFPEDVEAQYGKSRLVGEVCVVGIRDPSFERAEKLVAVVVPDFEYLKSRHIANSREAIRFELDDLGRRLPEYQRVHDYVIRAEPLPRTTTRKIKRFEVMKSIEEDAGGTEARGRVERFTPTPEDLELIQSPPGRIVCEEIARNLRDPVEMHPEMNLELDLGLDSLARAETLIAIERSTGLRIDPEIASAAHTVGEVIALVRESSGGAPIAGRAAAIDWKELLAPTPESLADAGPLLADKPFIAGLAYLALRIVRVLAGLLFGLEVSGLDHIRDPRRPCIVASNHQSYIDAFLIISTYPCRTLKHIFHVGASEYFSNPLMRRVARLLNIVPVDPELNLMRAMRAGAAGLRAGRILNIYPEGQRSFDGKLQEFKDGAAILALELDVPVITAAIDGAFRVWPRGSRRLHLAKVKIRFGPPMDLNAEIPAGLSDQERYSAATAVIRSRIEEMLERKQHRI